MKVRHFAWAGQFPCDASDAAIHDFTDLLVIYFSALGPLFVARWVVVARALREVAAKRLRWRIVLLGGLTVAWVPWWQSHSCSSRASASPARNRGYNYFRTFAPRSDLRRMRDFGSSGERNPGPPNPATARRVSRVDALRDDALGLGSARGLAKAAGHRRPGGRCTGWIVAHPSAALAGGSFRSSRGNPVKFFAPRKRRSKAKHARCVVRCWSVAP
jgi:hypothetical protein